MSVTGTVYWFTGLSGAGKSTLARLFCDRLRRAGAPVLLLDGDELREVFGDQGHARADRLAIAMRNGRLCKMIATQGIDVVCATISLFHECQDWNRRHIERYREIHVTAPMHVLESRDKHQLYGRARRGEVSDVVGVDIDAEEPRTPDLVIDNGGGAGPDAVVDRLWDALGIDSTGK